MIIYFTQAENAEGSFCSVTHKPHYHSACVNIASAEGSQGREKTMAEIKVGKNESLDTALKRFKRSCARDGVIAEVRKREHYEKPSVKRKKKSEAARKRKY